jgi:hypothetical protein
MLAILIGLPTWYVIGILINYSNRFAGVFYKDGPLDSGRSIMYAYVAISIGDILIGLLSQWLKSRKKALFICYGLCVLFTCLFFSPFNHNNNTMYFICSMLGFSTGFWAIFVTMGAEQFGTNLRSTAATTVPNMVRGSLPLMNLLCFNFFKQTLDLSLIQSAIITGIIVIIISIIAAYFTEETFNKDLNYIEM